MAEQSPMDVEGIANVVSSESQESYSDWLQKRLNNFDSFLGTSLKGLEDQAIEFLLVVEAKLNRRAKVNKKPCSLKCSGGKGFRELKRLFSSIKARPLRVWKIKL